MSLHPVRLPARTEFGALLRRARMAAGLSQNALARQAGIDPAYVNHLENDLPGEARTPRRHVVFDLAEACNLDGLETDRLLIAAGHCPELILQMPPEQYLAIYTLVGRPRVSLAERRVVP